LHYQKPFLKKLTVIILLLVVAISQCGYYCFCAMQLFMAKQAAQQEILKQIPENLLTKISVGDNEKSIKWEEEGKEFRLNGEMYDVVKVKYESGKEYLLCLSDKKEARVLESIEKVVKANNETAAGSGKHAGAKVIMPEWTWESPDNLNQYNPLSYIKKEYYNNTPALFFNFIEISSPPPDYNI
jgi:hypothetical protein